MLQTEMWQARSVSGVGEKSLLGLGDIGIADIASFMDKVIIPLLGIGASVYATYTSYELRKEALKLQKAQFEFQKVQAINELAVLKEQMEAQEAAKKNLLGVPYGNVILLGAGIVVVFMVFAARR